MRTLVWNTMPTHVAVEALYNADDARVDSVLNALVPPPTLFDDTAAVGSTYEVGVANLRGPTEWLPATEDTWRSWTGLRRVDGEDHHGPVYNVGTTLLYDGPRACPCGACQNTAQGALRYS